MITRLELPLLVVTPPAAGQVSTDATYPLADLIYWPGPGAHAIGAVVRAWGSGRVALEMDGAVVDSHELAPGAGDYRLIGRLHSTAPVRVRLMAFGSWPAGTRGYQAIPAIGVDGGQLHVIIYPGGEPPSE